MVQLDSARIGRHGSAQLGKAHHGRHGTASASWLGNGRPAWLPLPTGSTTGRLGRMITPHPETMSPEYVFTDAAAEEQIGVDAQTAGEELARIKAAHRILSAAVVVDESRPDDAPLHPAFEWRDPVAAEQWREHQASQIIRRVRVVPVEAPEPVAPRVSRAAAMPPPDLQLDDHDPLVWELDEAVKAVLAAKAKVEVLKERAGRRFDRRKQIQAGVALNDLTEADQLLEDARESLTASREPSQWASAVV